MRKRVVVLAAAVCSLQAIAFAAGAAFGAIDGIVQDPQHQPVSSALVEVRSATSGWVGRAQTLPDGRFSVPTVPAGRYVVSVNVPGFRTVEQSIAVRSDAVVSLSIVLQMAGVVETVHVEGRTGDVSTATATTEALVTRDEIEHTPGALRTNSLEAISQFVPGAYLIHDQLHIRGGHQVSWLVDGVPVPNTSIAANVGPQIDPKDIETLEVKRGGYAADYGDRTFGVFDVLPRSGFERKREAELVASYGTYRQTDDQVSVGDHSGRVAYYGSMTVNHTNSGLETPVRQILHDADSGIGGFGTFNDQARSTDAFRVVGSIRLDHYEIPNDVQAETAGADAHQRERDGYLNGSWLHTFTPAALLTVSPFYHSNRVAFDGAANVRSSITDDRGSQYLGAQMVLAVTRGPHSGRLGVYGFHERDTQVFAITRGAAALDQTQTPGGHVLVVFGQDRYALRDWLAIDGGIRLTSFSGYLRERAISPRLGAFARLPAGVTVHGFYGRYYQPPPLSTVSGPLLDFAAAQGFGFLPLEGERDEQFEVGALVTLHRWSIETDSFQTRAKNYFDHDAIGNSNIFIPLTIDTARIRGLEATLESPGGKRAHVHVAYAHQIVEGRGAVTGGLTDFEAPEDPAAFFFLDHDQRDTLAAGADVEVVRGTWVSVSLAYGSGFLHGDGPRHEPAHATLDLQASRTVGSRWTLRLTVLNVADDRFLLDESNTFGGTHWSSPRQVSVGVRYRFHY